MSEKGVMTEIRFRITINEEQVYYSSAQTEEDAWAEYERGELHLDHAEETLRDIEVIEE